MTTKNKVFIATSLDGYIADENGGIDWLHSIPNPKNDDMGYNDFMSGVDAIIMGRTTFEIVCGFDIEWPYKVPVFVLSNTLDDVPKKYQGKAEVVKGPLKEILNNIHLKGCTNVYVDGGRTIQSFLSEDLITEITITTIPILLGGGIPLFAKLPKSLKFKCVDSKIYLDQVVQNRFVKL